MVAVLVHWGEFSQVLSTHQRKHMHTPLVEIYVDMAYTPTTSQQVLWHQAESVVGIPEILKLEDFIMINQQKHNTM